MQKGSAKVTQQAGCRAGTDSVVSLLCVAAHRNAALVLLTGRFWRCFPCADELWVVSVLADVKVFYSGFTETEQFLNPFIKMSGVPLSRQINQQ